MRQRHLFTALHLALIAGFVIWFYAPLLEPGIPQGDFSSYVMGSVVEDRLLASPLSFPSWNPWLMCGRPTIGYMSPFRPLSLPFSGMDPITRLKALVVLFNVLAGWTLYALLRRSWTGPAVALFGALVYPVMPHTIHRTTHVHIVMFYALLPLILLAVLELRRRGAIRGVAWLGLVAGPAFVRDSQRTVLLGVMLAMLLVASSLVSAVGAGKDAARRERTRRHVLALVLVLAGFGLGAAIDAFDLVNGFVGDPFRGGYLPGEQSHWRREWSRDDIYTFFDRWSIVASRLESPSNGLFEPSRSSYLGLSLCALLLAGLLWPARLGPRRARFWLMLALFALSVWLSFGDCPLAWAARERWVWFFSSPGIPLALKLALLLAALALAGVLVAGVARSAGFERRPWLRAAAVCAAALALVAFTAPLPWLQKLVFFLRDFRNPDWFQVTVAPFAVVYAASLSLAGLASLVVRRGWRRLLIASVLLLTLADLRPYRARFDLDPELPRRVASAMRVIAEDPDDCRVMSAERYQNLVDLGAIWHGKRLAWDFRTYTAPRYTQQFFTNLFNLMARGGPPDAVAILAGIANVKYIVDRPGAGADVTPGPLLVPVYRRGSWVVYRNLAWRPLVQAYPRAHALVGSGRSGLSYTAVLAANEVGLVRLDAADAEDRPPLPGSRIIAEPGHVEAGRAPADTLVLGRDPLPLEPAVFERPPRLRWVRPAPGQILVDVDSDEPLLLVVSESFHPWWSVRLDDGPARLYPAEHAFLGSFVPAGTHRVLFRFRRPWTYWLWGAVSLVSLMLTLALLIVTRGTQTSGLGLLDDPPSQASSA